MKRKQTKKVTGTLSPESTRKEPRAKKRSATNVSYAKWKKHFDAWIAGQTSHNPNFDDSRESIYPDRW